LTGLNNLSDISGKLVSNLVNQAQETGSYSAAWSGKYDNGELVSLGHYFIRFSAGNVREVKQIILVR
jgi:flagellar hook assembly protein FlgD